MLSFYRQVIYIWTMTKPQKFHYYGKIIRNREHLRSVINDFENSHRLIPKSIAQILEGKIDEALLARVNRDTARQLSAIKELHARVEAGTKVIIDQAHVIHLDNSGHLTGVPAKRHKKDPHPLSANDFKNIPRIIHSPDLLSFAGHGRYGGKIKLEKSILHTQRLVIELVKKDNRFLVVSFYNLDKKKLP